VVKSLKISARCSLRRSLTEDLLLSMNCKT
jgi:hypothetical protein